MFVQSYKQFFHPWLSLVRGSADLLCVTWRAVSCLFSYFFWYLRDFAKLLILENTLSSWSIVPYIIPFLVLCHSPKLSCFQAKNPYHKSALLTLCITVVFLYFSESSVCLWQLEGYFEKRILKCYFFCRISLILQILRNERDNVGKNLTRNVS